jgi:hypothetical protein
VGVARLRAFARLPVAAGLSLVLGLAMGCVPADHGAAGPGTLLYVANSRDGTVTRLDAASGRAYGSGLPAGPAPWQLATGPAGRLVALSGLSGRRGEVTHVAPGPAGWSTTAVRLGEHAQDALLAGDGGRYAAVAYHVPDDGQTASTGHCRVALIDVLAGRVERTTAPCAEGEWLSGVALANGEAGAGPTAYVGLWDAPTRSATASPRRGRIVALDAASGRLRAAFPLAGAPSGLTVGPAPGGVGARLYAVESSAGPEREPGYTSSGRLLGLNPDTLVVESVRPLGVVPVRLAVAPDGYQAYALHDQDVLRLDLVGQADARLVMLPEPGQGLAVTRDRVYVSLFFENALWVLDRHKEGQARSWRMVPVGRHPTAVVLGRAD